jgi:hypothetical protein
MKSIKDVSIDEIREAASRCSTLTELVESLGFNGSSSSVRSKLNKILFNNDILVPHFPTNRATDRWTLQNVGEAVKHNTSYTQTLIWLDVAPRSGNFETLKRYISKFNIDTSHFSQKESCKDTKQRNGTDTCLSLADVLEGKHPHYSTSNLRIRLLNEGVFERKCSVCNLTEWRDLPIPVELDHINGVNDDHRLENLRLLCPNCHAQTPTYKGKNKNARTSHRQIVVDNK